MGFPMASLHQETHMPSHVDIALTSNLMIGSCSQELLAAVRDMYSNKQWPYGHESIDILQHEW